MGPQPASTDTAASLTFPTISLHFSLSFFFVFPRRARKFSRRPPSESSSIGFNATEAAHADPLTRQLMLMLLAVETKAKVSTPEEGGGGAVNRDWIR